MRVFNESVLAQAPHLILVYWGLWNIAHFITGIHWQEQWVKFREKYFIRSTEKIESSFYRRILQPCHISLGQNLTTSKYYWKELHLDV